MGGPVRIVLYATDRQAAEAAARAAFDAVASVDATMSDYREDSELNRFSRLAGRGPQRISGPLLEVLEAAQRVSGLSDGAFDVTVGPVVALWRRAKKEGALPDPRALSDALAHTGWQKLRVDDRLGTATLSVEGMRLDLGGIAKGYACDRALAALREHGAPRALVDGNGDLAVGDPPPDRPFWRVQIAGEPDKVLRVARCGVATSGDTERFVEIGGRRFSHIVDPHTGLGLQTRSKVTVVAPDGMTADALATAVSVMGSDRGMAMAERLPGVAAWMRWNRGEVSESTQSSAFGNLLRRGDPEDRPRTSRE